MKNTQAWKAAFAIGALVLAAGLAGCSSKSSPTAPGTGGGNVPPSGGVGTGSWNISVVATPNALALPDVGEPTPVSTVTISVRNASTGAPPPNGTSIVVTASGGTLSGQPLCSASTTTLCPQLVGGETTVIFTPTIAGTATVTAQLEQSIGRASISVSGVPIAGTFLLDHASPNSGDPSGGLRVTLFGQGFEAPIRVLFGASTAQVISVSATRAVVVSPPLTSPLPAGSTQPVNITVTNAIGTTHESSDTLINGFFYANGGSIETPVIFSFTPTTGPQEGGTPIVITGSHFQQESQVIFRINNTIDLEAPTNFADSGRLESLTPDIRPYIAAGTLNSPFNASIRVVNPNGATAVAPGQFTYGSLIRITSSGPGSGPYTGGTIVTVFGSGFDEPVAVSLGGIGQQVLSVSGTEIRFVTSGLSGAAIPPCGGQSSVLLISVTNIEGGASASGGGFVYTGPPNPLILGVNPTGGNIGSNVTISGQGFDPNALRVLFGGTNGSSAQIQGAATSTSVVVKVPTPPPSFNFTTVACDDNGDGTQGTRALPTPIDITVRNLVTGCEATLSNAYTVNPPDASCVGDVGPPTSSPACSDGVDNDGDGFTDFGGDAGCAAANGTSELTQCQDGIDNDSDTVFDANPPNAINPDPGCSTLQDTVEN